jgi:hypothetical protein
MTRENNSDVIFPPTGSVVASQVLKDVEKRKSKKRRELELEG